MSATRPTTPNRPTVISGIVLLDKPRGLSSNAALQKTRRLLKADKAGHVGSLDPLATGMLPICLGEATKIAGDILSGRKLYQFTVALGARTATGDVEGPVVETADVPTLDDARLRLALACFQGLQQQIPPMYSALKRDGQPLYKLARAGIEVEREARQIEVFSLSGNVAGARALELEVLCSKGTYVRTLAEDIARALGTCGHVTRLRRALVEPFETAAMQTLESLARVVDAGQAPVILACDAPLQHLPRIDLDATAAARILQGQAVTVAPGIPGRTRLYDSQALFMGMGEVDTAGLVQPRRLFRTAAPAADRTSQ